MKNQKEELFHYTSAERLPIILKSGIIKVASAGVPKNEKPAVWLTSRTDYEPTALKTQLMGGDAEFKLKKMIEMYGLARIKVKRTEDVITWDRFQVSSGIKPEESVRLAKIGIQAGANPEKWFACYLPISREDWLSIEIFDDGQWLKIRNKDIERIIGIENEKRKVQVAYGPFLFEYETKKDISETEFKEQVTPMIFERAYKFGEQVKIKGNKKRLEFTLQQIMNSLVIL